MQAESRGPWRPTLGAIPGADGTTFRVWAPGRSTVELILHPTSPAERRERLTSDGDGLFSGTFDAAAGDLYVYRLDGEGPYPDPCSRFQPQGVHGPSAVVDYRTFAWSDGEWRGVPLGRAVIYEVHVGTFTPQGTFAAAAARLGELAELGVTVVELMPIADFPGSRNWGYDGASLFAPSRAYGTPDDLRRLVDAAHRAGLGIVLDVVYNHFGPDGAYGLVFSPAYRSDRHESPWGPAINLDGEQAGHARAFFLENALHWVHEYRFDGLRLDATHWLIDDSTPHFVADLVARVRASVTDRRLLLMAEDERNLATMVRPVEEGGWGLDAVWADDFHHHVRRRAAGDADGYYQDFSGTIADLAATLRRGWFYCGQQSAYAGAPRGTDPAGIPPERMIICIQNHDQIGNRPFGRRLHHQIDLPLYRALSALLLVAPETPLLFMGQEWAASARFLYFTDHHEDLGRLVTEGRRKEFSRFDAFADEATRARIPDPQAPATFEASRLDWGERARAPHREVLQLYRALLRLRQTEPALRAGSSFQVHALDDSGLVLVRGDTPDEMLMLVAWLDGAGVYDLRLHGPEVPESGWRLLLSTEDDGAAPDTARAPDVALEPSLVVRFPGPAAVIVTRR